MATIDDIEKLVKAYAAKYPESQAVFDRPAYEKALAKYGPEKTEEMLTKLYNQLLTEFGRCAKIYDEHKAAAFCGRHPQGGCVCKKKG